MVVLIVYTWHTTLHKRGQEGIMGGRTLREIHEAEKAKWDARAPGEVRPEHLIPEGRDFHQAARRSVKLPGVSEFLGDLRGKAVIEYGSGLGQYTVLLARAGARVTTFDISSGALEFTKRRVAAHGLSDNVVAKLAVAEDLPFEDETFDIAFGTAILHHIDPAKGPSELYRLLKPGGKAAFTEPLGMNPLLNFARDHLPYPGKTPRGDDVPLREEHLRAWTANYRAVEVRGVQLLSMVERGFGFGSPFPRLHRMDDALLSRYPGLVRYCRYAVLMLTR